MRLNSSIGYDWGPLRGKSCGKALALYRHRRVLSAGEEIPPQTHHPPPYPARRLDDARQKKANCYLGGRLGAADGFCGIVSPKCSATAQASVMETRLLCGVGRPSLPVSFGTKRLRGSSRVKTLNFLVADVGNRENEPSRVEGSVTFFLRRSSCKHFHR